MARHLGPIFPFVIYIDPLNQFNNFSPGSWCWISLDRSPLIQGASLPMIRVGNCCEHVHESTSPSRIAKRGQERRHLCSAMQPAGPGLSPPVCLASVPSLAVGKGATIFSPLALSASLTLSDYYTVRCGSWRRDTRGPETLPSPGYNGPRPGRLPLPSSVELYIVQRREVFHPRKSLF